MGIGNWVTTRLRVRHLAGVLRSSASTQQARREAADELATMGGPAVPALVACLDHATEAVRDCAAAALAAIGEPAVPSLLVALGGPSEGAARAARALTDIGAAAAEPLCALLEHQEGPIRSELALKPAVRSWAVTILGRIGDLRCLERLLDDATVPYYEWGEDLNEAARSAVPEAIESMAQRDREGVVSALEEALATSSQAHVLEAAEQALRLLTASPITDGVRKLEEACLDEGLLTATAMAIGDEAAEMIAAEGVDGALALATLLCELLACRSAKVLSALTAAEQAEPVPELVRAVSSVASAPPMAPQPRGARFTPRLVGAGTVGWDDETAGRIRRYASGVLASLERKQSGGQEPEEAAEHTKAAPQRAAPAAQAAGPSAVGPAMTLPCRDLAAVVLFLENWPGEPPGGVGYAAALFRELNPRAFEVVARQRPNLSLECRKLEGPPEQFAAAAAEIAGDLLAQRHHPGMLVCQNASVQGPSRTHRFLLCSYFRAAKPTIVVLELGSSFELE